MGRGAEMQAAEAAERNWCFTMQGKDLASAYVLCPRLGTGCLNL